MNKKGLGREFSKKMPGFTLIEVLVSLAIMTILMLLIIVRMQGINSADRNLRNNSQELASVFILAKDYAHSGYDCCAGDDENGYGVYVDLDNSPDKYLLFADKNDNYIYDESTDEIIDSFSFKNNVKWYSVAPYTATGYIGSFTGDWSFCFPLPSGKMYSNGKADNDDIRLGLDFDNLKFSYLNLEANVNKIDVDSEIYDTPLD
ncbi:MAG: prepilin-type N-terminal cleavage/methylation domain-containing protein [Patescibacteria group bacterium]